MHPLGKVCQACFEPNPSGYRVCCNWSAKTKLPRSTLGYQVQNVLPPGGCVKPSRLHMLHTTQTKLSEYATVETGAPRTPRTPQCKNQKRRRKRVARKIKLMHSEGAQVVRGRTPMVAYVYKIKTKNCITNNIWNHILFYHLWLDRSNRSFRLKKRNTTTNDTERNAKKTPRKSQVPVVLSFVHLGYIAVRLCSLSTDFTKNNCHVYWSMKKICTE